MADGAGHDTAAVATLLGRALAGVQDFDQITKRANTIRTNIDAIDNTAGRIRQTLEDDIAKALRLISSATLEAA